MPAPELPQAWQKEILAQARREIRSSSRQPRVPLTVWLFQLGQRNPFTTTALATLWALILIFKATTPVSTSNTEWLAHLDPNQPIHFLSISEEILLANLEPQESQQPAYRPIP